MAQRVRARQPAWPTLLFLAFLVALQIVAITGAAATSATAFGQSALLAFAVVIAAAWLVDRGKPQQRGLG